MIIDQLPYQIYPINNIHINNVRTNKIPRPPKPITEEFMDFCYANPIKVLFSDCFHFCSKDTWARTHRRSTNEPTGISRIVRNRTPHNNPNIRYHENETVRNNFIRNMHLIEKIIGRPFDGKLTKSECRRCMEKLQMKKFKRE
jgi:hypothetical protein